MDLAEHGVLEKYGVEMIGASAEAIDKAEDREQFKAGDGEDRPGVCRERPVARRWTRPASVLDDVGLPCVLRPSFTWAAPAAASPTTARSSTAWSPTASSSARSTRC